jgi:3-methyl-2-oxobutanoate hydroxymethyltransferase
MQKKTTLLTLRELKARGEKAVFITAYDHPLAALAEKAGADMILVGDSLGMTTLGYDSTLPVTMNDMVRHAQAVTRAARRAFVVGDLPFMSYQPSDRDAILNAGRLIAEAGCDAVKCEGGRRVAPRVKAMVDAGIVVMGHIGLTPQNQAQLGGYRVQGKTAEATRALVDDALALEAAGASFILVEAMPPETAAAIRDAVAIPVYGIGAGDRVDGQLVIVHDLIGLFDQFTPKFVKRYCEAGRLIEAALTSYCADVRSGAFPGPEHFYSGSAARNETAAQATSPAHAPSRAFPVASSSPSTSSSANSGPSPSR